MVGAIPPTALNILFTAPSTRSSPDAAPTQADGNPFGKLGRRRPSASVSAATNRLLGIGIGLQPDMARADRALFVVKRFDLSGLKIVCGWSLSRVVIGS